MVIVVLGNGRSGGEGVLVVGGPGVRLMMCSLASVILDVTCSGDRKEVSWDAWKMPVSCKSMGPLAKLKKRPIKLSNKLIAWWR